MTPQLELPLFPLGTVLFKDGLLPLHVFEPRYVTMVENAIETETGFGVVLLKNGSEVHEKGTSSPPPIHNVGTLASLREHKRLDDGRFYVLAEGGAKFHVETTWELEDHLRMAQVRIEMDEPKLEIRSSDAVLVDILQKVVDAMGAEAGQLNIDFDDASSVSMRLSEHLAIDLQHRQKLLELNDAHQRFNLIWEWLRESSTEVF